MNTVTEQKIVEVKKTELLEITLERVPVSDKIEIYVRSPKLREFFKGVTVSTRGSESVINWSDANGDVFPVWSITENFRYQGGYLSRVSSGVFPPRLANQDASNIDLSFLLLKDLDMGVKFTVSSQVQRDVVKAWLLAVKEAIQKIYEQNMRPLKYKMSVSIEEFVDKGVV